MNDLNQLICIFYFAKQRYSGASQPWVGILDFLGITVLSVGIVLLVSRGSVGVKGNNVIFNTYFNPFFFTCFHM